MDLWAGLGDYFDDDDSNYSLEQEQDKNNTHQNTIQRHPHPLISPSWIYCIDWVNILFIDLTGWGALPHPSSHQGGAWRLAALALHKNY